MELVFLSSAKSTFPTARNIYSIMKNTPADAHTPHYALVGWASVIVPTGGTITYTYYRGEATGYPAPNGSHLWAFNATHLTPAQIIGTMPLRYLSATTTTVTDPSGNVSVIQFQGITKHSAMFYQGSTSGRPRHHEHLLHGSASPCNGTAVDCHNPARP